MFLYRSLILGACLMCSSSCSMASSEAVEQKMSDPLSKLILIADEMQTTDTLGFTEIGFLAPFEFYDPPPKAARIRTCETYMVRIRSATIREPIVKILRQLAKSSRISDRVGSPRSRISVLRYDMTEEVTILLELSKGQFSINDIWYKSEDLDGFHTIESLIAEANRTKIQKRPGDGPGQ